MLSKKSQRNGAHYIKDPRTTGPWGGKWSCNFVEKKKANKANDSDAINDSARPKSHSINGLPPLGTNSFHADSATKICNFLFCHKACSPYHVVAD